MDVDNSPQTTMDKETERAIDDIKATLVRMEGKLDIIIPQAAAQNERIKNLENQLKWLWTVIGGLIVATVSQFMYYRLIRP